MNIRQITHEDLMILDKLHCSLFSQSFNFEDYANQLPFHYGLIIESNNSIVGYLVGQLIFEMGDLFYIAVDPKYRGKAFGTRLMDYFISDARSRNVEMISLEVRLSNQPAISLYEKCGFKQVGLRKNYYTDGEDAALMIYTL